MKRLILIVVAVLALVSAGVAAYNWNSGKTTDPILTTATATRGDIVETVEATGTLEAVETVEVGTQVSGTIKELHADFNSQVRKGQVIAQLEPSLFATQVAQARATVARMQADVEAAKVNVEDTQIKLRRARELMAKELIPATDLETAEASARQAQASLKAAEAQLTQGRASLNQSQVNLGHTTITAPIDGIVIDRPVDVGQTVAASMQAPTLFVLARDLRHMQVNAAVDEADIGRIRAGQPVTFQVDAYSGETFTGTVKQVRLQPKVEQNVVSYVTVIDVPNDDLKLKPGMTANVTIEIARADNVLRVPNAALRFRPTTEVFTALGQQAPEPRAAGQRQTPGGAGISGSAGTSASAGPRALWVLAEGRLSRVRAQFGISDGTMTAVDGGDLQEGAAVVTGVAAHATAAAPSSTGSPLLPQRPGQRRTQQQQTPARSR